MIQTPTQASQLPQEKLSEAGSFLELLYEHPNDNCQVLIAKALEEQE